MLKRGFVCGLVLLGILWITAHAVGLSPGQATPPTEQQTIICRVMEVFAAEESGATAVIFHQRDKSDGPRLGDWLQAHNEERIEFETSDGKWHRATVFRVKSCFGRGLLLFPSAEAKLAPHDEFTLRNSEGR